MYASMWLQCKILNLLQAPFKFVISNVCCTTVDLWRCEWAQFVPFDNSNEKSKFLNVPECFSPTLNILLFKQVAWSSNLSLPFYFQNSEKILKSSLNLDEGSPLSPCLLRCSTVKFARNQGIGGRKRDFSVTRENWRATCNVLMS